MPDFLTTEHILSIAWPLLATHSPTGHEDEAVKWVCQWMEERLEEVRVDAAGNVVGCVRGIGDGAPVALLAHLDEIGMIVKRIEPDGKIRLGRLGGSHPWKYGEGPVDLLGEGGVTPGFLCFGAMHASPESKEIHAAKTATNLKWDVVWVDCKLSPEELGARGVFPGTKVVLSRSRKVLTEVGAYFGAFAIDDKALVAVMLALLEDLQENPPPGDVYLVATVGEEIGSGRAAYACGEIPAETFLALEVAPVLPEYDLKTSPEPVILYKDEYNVYDESVCRELTEACGATGITPQRAVLSSFGSDLSAGARGGRFARYGCIAIPTENTHGYEVIHRESLGTLARTIAAWIRR